MKTIRWWGLAAMMALGPLAYGQAPYPSHPIRVVVPFGAGGTPDTVARQLAAEMDKRLKTRVVVDNKPGANGVIGAADVAKAAPDGYTLLHVTTSFVINPYVYKKLPYDIGKDFVPVVNVATGTGYLLMVNPALPVRTVAELVDYGRKAAKPITYSSPGIGNTLHLAGELFAARAGMSMLHVPYKSASQELNAVAAGDVDIMFIPPTIALPYVQSGKVRPLGFTGEQRTPEYPDAPTMAQAGVADFVLPAAWQGLFAPAGTPQAAIDTIAATVRDIVAQPAFAKMLRDGGYEPDPRAGKAFAELVRADSARYAEAVKRAGIEAQ